MFPYSPWFVWLTPLFASLFVPLVAKISHKARDYFTITVSIVVLVFAVSMIPDIYFGKIQLPTDISTAYIPQLNVQVGVLLDPLSVLFTNLIAFVGFIVIVYSLEYMAGEEGLTRYYFLMLFYIGSMIGLVIVDNFLFMYIFWELVGVCSFLLIAFWYKRPEAVSAGVKAFIMTRVGDVCLLGGILLLYFNVHSFSFLHIASNVGRIAFPILQAAAFLTLVGAIAKSAQLPLHSWLYSAMAAPASVSCLLHGATMVKAGVYLIARTHIIFEGVPLWLATIAWGGAITAVIGATLALHTPDIKGVPAYSTVSQIGYMMLALGVASSASSLGWFAGLFHMINHAFFQGIGFLVAGAIIHLLGTRDMREMGGLRRAMPITFAVGLVAIFSRSGFPPFSGFFSKGLIFDGVYSTGNWGLIFLIWIATALTFAYSLRWLSLVFLGNKHGRASKVHLHETSPLMYIPAVVFAVLCVILGFLEPYLINFMHVNLSVQVSEFSLVPEMLMLISLFVGGFPTYLVYYRKSISADVFRRGKWKIIDKILEKNYFIDDAYKIFVNGILRLCWIFFSRFEVRRLDQFNYSLADSAVFAYKRVRKLQTGFLFNNMLLVLSGFIILLVIALLLTLH